jgi:hypothetical protein
VLPPLFILSPPRSFTTVATAMLGNHPEMFGLAETNLFVAETLGDLAFLHRLRPRLQHGLLRSMCELGFGEQTEETVEAAKAWLAENPDLTTIEMFSVLGEWAGERSLIEKSPFHVYKLEALQRMHRGFPDAYYLHLTRHPVSTWTSNNEIRAKIAETSQKMARFAQWGQGQMINQGELDIEKLWLDPHLRVIEFFEEIPADHQLRIRGEDLLKNPRFYLAQICEWLGKRHDDATIEAMLHPERSPFAKYGPSNARLGNDPKFMESPELRPYTPKPMPLSENPLPDTPLQLSPTLIHYAETFGY